MKRLILLIIAGVIVYTKFFIKECEFDGKVTSHDNNGVLQYIYNYDNCVPHGTWTDYYPNGIVMRQGYFKQGLQFWQKEFGNDGNLKKEQLFETDSSLFVDENYIKEGRIYFPNQTLRVKTTYDNDGNGVGHTYYLSGNLKSKYNHKNKKIDGEYLEWWDNGNLRVKTVYKENLILSEELFDEDGVSKISREEYQQKVIGKKELKEENGDWLWR